MAQSKSKTQFKHRERGTNSKFNSPLKNPYVFKQIEEKIEVKLSIIFKIKIKSTTCKCIELLSPLEDNLSQIKQRKFPSFEITHQTP